MGSANFASRLSILALLLLCRVSPSSSSTGRGRVGGGEDDDGGVPLISLDAYKTARCLDGTPGGFYFQAAKDPDQAQMWVIHLQGGGECSTKQECSRKVKSVDGSSSFFPPAVNFSYDPTAPPQPSERYDVGGVYRGKEGKNVDGGYGAVWDAFTSLLARRREGGGGDEPGPDGPVMPASWMRNGWWLLGDVPKTNPHMWGWNHVLVPYCSQDLHSGQRVEATHLEDMDGLYFSGHIIFQAVLSELDKRGLKKADTIILTGHSAGGIGTWLHVDWLAERYPYSQVKGAPIAGFYFFSYQYEGPGSTAGTQQCSLSDFSQRAWPSHWVIWDSFVDYDCSLQLNDRPWECMVANVSYPYIASPMFITQAQTDQIVLEDHDCIPRQSKWSPEVEQYVKQWHKNMSSALHHAVNTTDGDGMFSAACYTHANFTQTAPLIKKKSFLDAISLWLEGKEDVFEDECGDICNPTCTDG